MDQLLYTGLVGDGSSSSNNSNFYADTQMIMSDELKSQIANHPLYPNLLSASIECTKVGVPPEMASLLEEISKENLPFFGCSQIGSAADPELDQFMISYCEVLHKYKDEVSKTFEEATRFLSGIESQLARLCKSQTPPPPATACSYYHYSDDEEDFCFGGLEANGIGEYIGTRRVDEELKEQLMRKYSGYLCSLRGEFSKKRKKGKLPKDATTALLEWWNAHYRWPYPTEDEKNELSGITGLDLKQINNWFINQRKRHWRPTEDMQLALMEGASGMYIDATGGVDI